MSADIFILKWVVSYQKLQSRNLENKQQEWQQITIPQGTKTKNPPGITDYTDVYHCRRNANDVVQNKRPPAMMFLALKCFVPSPFNGQGDNRLTFSKKKKEKWMSERTSRFQTI